MICTSPKQLLRDAVSLGAAATDGPGTAKTTAVGCQVPLQAGLDLGQAAAE
jgi:hypothetical protein